MKSYARVDGGRVVELFPPVCYDVDVEGPANEDGTPGPLLHRVGDEVPIDQRFHPEFVVDLVSIPSGADVSVGDSWTMAHGFGPPPALPPEPPSVPQAVTMRQARLALLAVGQLQAVSDAIAGLPSPQKEAAQIEWDFAAVVERQSQIVQLLGPALGLDEGALDALFVQAAGL
jgi:hypothetical protein